MLLRQGERGKIKAHNPMVGRCLGRAVATGSAGAAALAGPCPQGSALGQRLVAQLLLEAPHPGQQRLIADRKFLAAYYTTPASAALLVGLAIAPETPPRNGDWGKSADVAAMRVTIPFATE